VDLQEGQLKLLTGKVHLSLQRERSHAVDTADGEYSDAVDDIIHRKLRSVFVWCREIPPTSIPVHAGNQPFVRWSSGKAEVQR